jgi:hypothetical protein
MITIIQSRNQTSTGGVLLVLIAAMLAACNQPFDPRGELDRKPVVFSVISTDRAQQFVRVEWSYMPEGYDPASYTSDAFISDAVVTINTGGLTRKLNDTTLVRLDTSRFRFPIRAYVANPLKADYGSLYTLRVQTSGGETATASFVMPARPMLTIDLASTAVIDHPSEHDTAANILFPMTFGNGSYGYVARFFVYYDVLKNGEWIEERLEVPSRYAASDYHSMNLVVYPQLAALGNTNKGVGVYKNQLYAGRLGQVAYVQYGSTNIIFKWAVFVVTQVESNLYKYYNLTHSYRDIHSIRLDEPMYSSLSGGTGVFGGYTIDSLVRPLPEFFAFNHH